jgi:glucosamine kinase
MTLFLGIDGGGSGCRAALCDRDGTVLGRGASGPANIATNAQDAHDNILAAAAGAMPPGVDPMGVEACLGLAGANAGSDLVAFASALPFRRSRIVSDAVTAIKGALRDDDGIVAAVGTGSVFACQRGMQVTQIGGWGFCLGDEASGAWIGREALKLALRARDGMTADTPWLKQLRDRMGGADGIVRFAALNRAEEFAALARDVMQSDDPAAEAVRARADAEILEYVRRLAQDDDLPVVFTGGLGDAFAQRLAVRCRVRTAYGTPLDGALWLARTSAEGSST